MDQLDIPTEKAVLLAWNKLLWILNGLFARHYVVGEGTGKKLRGVLGKVDNTKLGVYGIFGGLVGVVSTMAYGYFGTQEDAYEGYILALVVACSTRFGPERLCSEAAVQTVA